MAGSTEKRRQLDDEMSRFEAEISGVPKLGSQSPPPSQAGGLRPIIGSNTFRQVQQQLQQATPDVPALQPPPELPSLPGPNKGAPILRESFHGPGRGGGHPHRNEPRPQNMPGPQGFGPRSPDSPRAMFNPRNNSQGGRGSIYHGPQDGPPPNGRPGMFGPLVPPPPPPFLSQHPSQGGPNFSGRGLPPPPPPGFVPPQVNRSIGGPGPGPGPMMGPPGPNMGPSCPPVSFLPPPPPPPGLLPQGPNLSKVFSSASPTFSKPAAIISSAPKLYTKESTEEALVKTTQESPTVVEQKKKKQKIEVKQSEPPVSSVSHALEMAEKVKQTTITTKLPTIHNGPSHTHSEDKKKEKKPRKNLRYAGGQIWEDPGLNEWDPDDFRMFAGDLGNDVTDELLHRYFSHFPSFVKAKVVREKRTNKSKGYGFVSFRDPQDYIRAMKEMNGKYVGSRPIKLRKSSWKERSLDVVQRKTKEKQMQGLK